MENEVNEMLGISDNKCPMSDIDKEEVLEYSAEKLLKSISSWILFFGIIASFLMAFTITTVDVEIPASSMWGKPTTEVVVNPYGIVITIMTCFSTIISWGLMNVIAGISITLKKINAKIGNVEKWER